MRLCFFDMRQILCFTILVLLFGESLYGQMGLVGEFRLSSFPEATNLNERSPQSNLSFALGPVYTFRLKRKRLEFFPSLMVAYSNLKFKEIDLKYRELDFSFHFPIAIYPFDFDNDCNCPTFNKQGERFRKGFYLLFTPAVHYQIKSPDQDTGISSLNDISYSARIGLGFDFALSKSSTLSPNIQIFRSFSERFIVDNAIGEIGQVEDSRIGVALMLRYLWYKKTRR